MTKGDAIKVLEQIRQWTDYPKEALTMAIEALSKPELPSNLDEAANDYCSAYYDWDNEGERKEVVITFKAGAEWMAGQGVSWEDIMTYYDGFLLYDKDERAFTMEEDFNEGDKVIVQIRKK